jgi:hypothetical protein
MGSRGYVRASEKQNRIERYRIAASIIRTLFHLRATREPPPTAEERLLACQFAD